MMPTAMAWSLQTGRVVQGEEVQQVHEEIHRVLVNRSQGVVISFYDEGVEMSAVYHSIISTLKLNGKSVWNFFGDFFRCEVLGSDTYKEYLPALTR